MDWAVIFEALGGGPGAMMIVASSWFAYNQMKKADALTSILMERKDEDIRASERREIAVQQSLQAVMRVIERGREL